MVNKGTYLRILFVAVPFWAWGVVLTKGMAKFVTWRRTAESESGVTTRRGAARRGAAWRDGVQFYTVDYMKMCMR